METKFGENLHHVYGPVVSDLKAVGKKRMEWDLNDWRWDGDLFVATPLNPVPSDCGSKQFFRSDIPVKTGASTSISSRSDEVMLGDAREKRDSEKRPRSLEINEQVNEEAGSLNLKLGGMVFPVMEREVDKSGEKSGKKSKVSSAPSSRAVCQVEDCKADLSNAKDYHRRHKVCEVHSKATTALVGNILQRFCQQCSRFHVLQEFDEGKRSCRRRLAGHNKRRRKTHPENVVNATALNDEQGCNYLLISLLRILSNMQSSSSDQTKDQDLLYHLLRNLASLAGSSNETKPAGLLTVSRDLQNDCTRPAGPAVTVPSSTLIQQSTMTDNAQGGVTQNASASQQSSLPSLEKANNSVKSNASDAILGKGKLNNFDLNNVYDVSQDCTEDLQYVGPENRENASTVVPLWLCKEPQQSSPAQNSGNSGLTPSQSPSTSSGGAQSRTDRIVFKLFGKDPSDFPIVLRKQILDWLSSSPTDIESYIRPGCVILTIYVSMDGPTLEELYCSFNSRLGRLLNSYGESFWRTGWIYARVRHHATFVYNGQIVFDAPLPLKIHGSCKISSITPIAVSFSETVHFAIKGLNLSRSTSRFLCALEGKYLVLESCTNMTGGAGSFIEHEEIECLSFSCAIPNIVGRGFIEVEDHGLSSSFFPFIVAEKDVCSEIRYLESIIEVSEPADGDTNKLDARNRALDFVHELGWLFHKSGLISRFGEISGKVDPFPFKRFRWLVEFAIDHDWSAVVKKLLSILLDGIVDTGQHSSILVALQDIGPLHRAVRKNSRFMVEFLLAYRASGVLNKTGQKQKQLDEGQYLFRPDTVGHGGLTPLHIAANIDSCESVVDALTEDPGSVGIEAWKNARDSAGLTPHNYACLRGHYSYIHLVQRKLNKKLGKGQVVVNIPGTMKVKMGNAEEMVAISLYKGNLHKAPDIPRRWLCPPPNISLKDFRILLRRRARALSRLRFSNADATTDFAASSKPNRDQTPKPNTECGDTDWSRADNAVKGDGGGNQVHNPFSGPELPSTEELKEGEGEKEEGRGEGRVKDERLAEGEDFSKKLAEKPDALVENEKNKENLKEEDKPQAPVNSMVEKSDIENAARDVEKRIKEVKGKLEILNEKKHSLVQVLKQILNAEEQLKRQNNAQGISGRPPLPLQVDAANDSGSRLNTPRIGSDGNPCGDIEGGEAEDASNHNMPTRQLPRVSSTSPSSDTQQQKPASNMVPLSYRTTLGIAGSPSRFALAGQGQRSVSISGASYIASSPSPATSGGTSVFRDGRLPSPWN